MLSFDERGQLRWRTPVTGTPLSAQFTGDGNLLFVTQLGQVNVVDPQTGRTVAAPYDLIPRRRTRRARTSIPCRTIWASRTASRAGRCARWRTSPAIDLDNGRIVVTFWRPGAPQADLVALRYGDGERPRITEEWSRAPSPPAAHLRGAVAGRKDRVRHDNAGHLWALDAESGSVRWQYDLGYAVRGGPSSPAVGRSSRRARRTAVSWPCATAATAPRCCGNAPTSCSAVRPPRRPGPPHTPSFGTATTAWPSSPSTPRPGRHSTRTRCPRRSDRPRGTSVGPGGEVLTPTLIGELFVLK